MFVDRRSITLFFVFILKLFLITEFVIDSVPVVFQNSSLIYHLLVITPIFLRGNKVYFFCTIHSLLIFSNKVFEYQVCLSQGQDNLYSEGPVSGRASWDLRPLSLLSNEASNELTNWSLNWNSDGNTR